MRSTERVSFRISLPWNECFGETPTPALTKLLSGVPNTILGNWQRARRSPGRKDVASSNRPAAHADGPTFSAV